MRENFNKDLFTIALVYRFLNKFSFFFRIQAESLKDLHVATLCGEKGLTRYINTYSLRTILED